MATNEEKAKMYDQLLKEYDVKAREVSILKSKFDLTREEQKQIKTIKEEMDLIQRKAMNLGSL
tara:strand:- start:4362 stop:4550 length:189 start_codon:yes stop_codon:yes gene_type:complete